MTSSPKTLGKSKGRAFTIAATSTSRASTPSGGDRYGAGKGPGILNFRLSLFYAMMVMVDAGTVWRSKRMPTRGCM